MNRQRASGSSYIDLADQDAVRQVFVDATFGLWVAGDELPCPCPSRYAHYRSTT